MMPANWPISAMAFLLVFNIVQSRADETTSVRSGYYYASPETKAIQDDSFANPGTLWVEAGEARWNQKDGPKDKSCSDCHDDPELLADAVTGYPKYEPALGKPLTLGQRINRCRVSHMGGKPYAPESEPLLSLEILLRARAAGRPMQVTIDGPMRPTFERGRQLYFQRRGQFNLACHQCHDDRPGEFVRGERLSEGQINNFPSYLLRWSGVGSAQRRFQLCDAQARAEPRAIWSEDYVALEVYVAHRGRGLPIEAPAVRR